MVKVEVSQHINASADRCFAIWQNPEILANEIKNIRNLEVIKRGDSKVFTSWEVQLGSATLKWRQVDYLDRRNGIIHFNMYDGELTQYRGSWHILAEADGKTILRLNASIDLGISVLEPHMQSVLLKKSRAIFKGFLKKIKKVAES